MSDLDQDSPFQSPGCDVVNAEELKRDNAYLNAQLRNAFIVVVFVAIIAYKVGELNGRRQNLSRGDPAPEAPADSVKKVSFVGSWPEPGP